MTVNKTSRWSKKRLFLYSIFTVLLLVLAFEVFFRVLFYFQYRNLHTSIAVQGNTLQVSDSLLIFKNQPFYVDYGKSFQNNEEGMKSALGDVFIPKKTGDDFWVLLTGGSAMEGMGSNKDGKWLDITGVTDHPYDHTIAFYLQELLQKQLPEKRVKVFNAAASSYSIYQSYWRYRTLADKIKPDWVVSMDGVNERHSIGDENTVRQRITANWKTYPQFHFPIKFIVPITRHSAFVNTIKQVLFHGRLNYRLKKAMNNNFPERKKWASYDAPVIQMPNETLQSRQALASFQMWINKYDSILNARQVKHLFLIQPHLAFRDTTNLCETEKALLHYYGAEFQNPSSHIFLNSLYSEYPTKDSVRPIFPMSSVNHWPEWVFVDYCHFTDAATKKIAKEIFKYVVSNGTQKPFQ